MDIAAIILTLAVFILVGLYLYTPYLHGYGRRVTREEHQLSALMAEQDRVLSSLRELDFDFKLGKIPEEDYPAQRTSLLQKGADLLRKIDSLTETNGLTSQAVTAARKSRPRKAVSDDSLESMIAMRRKSRKGSFDGFCPKCGKPVVANDRFCPSCGKALKQT
jgi:hypothetical protein